GQSDSLLIMDCATDSIISRLPSPVPGFFWGFPTWDSVQNKLYVVLHRFGSAGRLAVYDCATDSLLTLITVPVPIPYNGYFNYRMQRGYFTPYDGTVPFVIDIKEDRYLKYFPVHVSYATLEPIAIDTIDNKVYLSRAEQYYPDTLYVIDCFTDSIVKKIVEAGWGPLSVRWASWNNRLYFTGGPRGETLKVLDCRTDSVIGRLYLHQYGLTGPPHLILDPDRRRIFAVGQDSSLYVLREVVPGVEQREEKGFNRLEPTIVRNILYLPDTGDPGYVLLDITGSRVRELKSGANDVRSVAPGVYFIREDSAVVRKVVIAH
ncbi:MAG: hypothetical protein ACP5PK_08015, partial [candidate division WOR-3 bacterium]